MQSFERFDYFSNEMIPFEDQINKWYLGACLIEYSLLFTFILLIYDVLNYQNISL